MVVASLLDRDTNTEENLRLVWGSPLAPLRIRGAAGLMNYKFLSLLVMLVAGLIYFAFRSPSAEQLEAWKKGNPEAARLQPY